MPPAKSGFLSRFLDDEQTNEELPKSNNGIVEDEEELVDHELQLALKISIHNKWSPCVEYIDIKASDNSLRNFCVPTDVAYLSESLKHIYRASKSFSETNGSITLPFEEAIIVQILDFMYCLWMESIPQKVSREPFKPKMEDVLVLMDAALYLDLHALVMICSELAAKHVQYITSFENLPVSLLTDILKRVTMYDLRITEFDESVAKTSRDVSKIWRTHFKNLIISKPVEMFRPHGVLLASSILKDEFGAQVRSECIARLLETRLSRSLEQQDYEMVAAIAQIDGHFIKTLNLEFGTGQYYEMDKWSGLTEMLPNLVEVTILVKGQLSNQESQIISSLLPGLSRVECNFIFEVSQPLEYDDVELITGRLINHIRLPAQSFKQIQSAARGKKPQLPSLQNSLPLSPKQNVITPQTSPSNLSLSFKRSKSGGIPIHIAFRQLSLPFTCVSSLDFSHQPLDGNSTQLLSTFLESKPPSLFSLNMSRTNLGAKGVSTIIQACSTLSLKHIDLSFNIETQDPHNPEAVSNVSKYIVSTSTLETLVLAGNHFGPSGTVTICESLAKNASITSLDVSNMDLSLAFPELCRAITKSSVNVKTLIMNSVTMLPRIIMQGLTIFENCRVKVGLERLAMGGNAVTKECAVIIGRIVVSPSWKALTHLDLSGGSSGQLLEDSGCETLFRGLVGSTTLIHVDISGQRVGNNTCGLLARILPKCGLQEVIMRQTLFPMKGLELWWK
ncbi:RNI-like protein [Rhizoclosmatium globosum]|uniref:RNI-like protein n=1 Tax=Rhizoclosmatium globosum TaxID=329046 RepID=A0A1Y2BXU4_9FUNG|nr:RNI-like protein [Rhizoclosmatium globosum]|eukprot:ORY39566.1 RNI-like protein [Rhizoclosmatium globosum]